MKRHLEVISRLPSHICMGAAGSALSEVLVIEAQPLCRLLFSRESGSAGGPSIIQAVSNENAEIAGRMLRLIEDRDEEGFVECFDSNCEFLLPRNLLEGGSYRGSEGVQRALADIYATWEEVHFEIEDVRAAGSQVVVLSRTTNVGRRGAPPVTYLTAYYYEIQGGQILYFRPYESVAEALEAAGLSE